MKIKSPVPVDSCSFNLRLSLSLRSGLGTHTHSEGTLLQAAACMPKRFFIPTPKQVPSSFFGLRPSQLVYALTLLSFFFYLFASRVLLREPPASLRMDESSLRTELAAAISSGAKELDWSNRGLRSLPSGIGGLIHLEKWNLAGNLLEDLPDELSQLGSLRTLFFLNNRFTRIPPVVGRLPNLFMLSFKSNRLEAIAEDALPPSLGWLILTDNRLAALPAVLGRLPRLRKLMLASNQLTSLPDIGGLAALELVRLSDNRLHEVPAGLLALPRLAWVALAGNRFPPLPRDAVAAALAAAPPGLQAKDLEMGEKLGEGASGTVFAATDAHGGAVAVKVFKAASSDGRPEDEVRAPPPPPPPPPPHTSPTSFAPSAPSRARNRHPP
jgi:Leucine-rich repeat (LRR) protein